MARTTLMLLALGAVLTLGCGSDEAEVDRLGVGAACTQMEDCADTAPDCLTNFKGGYCGIADCKADADCPEGSACVTHDDGKNYCFRLCNTKEECNANRPEEVWSNCAGNVQFVAADRKDKACVPPSGN